MNKIDTGHEIPQKTIRATRWALIASQMKIRDSVLVDNPNEAVGLRVALKIRGKKATQRKEADGKVRVWRTK